MSRVNVVVNTVCPGLVSTSLGRSMAESSRWLKVLVPIHQRLLGKSADFGARFYVKAARTSIDEHVSPLSDYDAFYGRLYRAMANAGPAG